MKPEDIEFSGRRIDNGKTVCGYLYSEPSDKNKWRILDFNNEWDYPIDEKTIRIKLKFRGGIFVPIEQVEFYWKTLKEIWEDDDDDFDI